MTRDNVMSTPIFDELLREMAQRAGSHTPATPATPEPVQPATPDPARPTARRRHRAE